MLSGMLNLDGQFGRPQDVQPDSIMQKDHDLFILKLSPGVNVMRCF
jgi:hypothetical protein